MFENEWFGQVRWNNEDLASALREVEVEPSKENISFLRYLVDTPQFTEYLISAGWDFINSIAEDNAEFMTNELEDENNDGDI